MKEKLELIRSVKLDEPISYERLLELFFSIENLPSYIVPLVKGSIVYRSRQNENSTNYCTFKDLSYPPLDCVKYFSRVNKPFQNLFYCSDSWETNLTEFMPNWFWNIPSGDVIAVTCGKWEVAENLKIVVIPDFNNPKMKLFNEKAEIKKLGDESLMLLSFINNIFNENSMLDKNVYKITCAFSNVIRTYYSQRKIPIDGILYTSAQDKIGFNLAINTDVINSKKIILRDLTKHFITKRDNIPTYDNCISPIKPLKIDFENEKINWL